MPDFDYARFIDVAENLIADMQGEDEGNVRTACGRAYYGVYGKLKSRMVSLWDVFGSNSYHRPLSQICTEDLKRYAHIRKLGRKLERLFEYRRDADYSPAKTMEKTDAESAIDLAKGAVVAVGNLSADDLTRMNTELERHVAAIEAKSKKRDFT